MTSSTRCATMLLAVLAIGGAGCGTKVKPPPAVGNQSDTGTGTSTPAATDDVVVIAKIVGSGPIGDGNCSQRSYEVAIGTIESGALPDPQPSWVHFERCGDAAVESFIGTGLVTGTTYRLSLRRGASTNFPGDYMIVDARAP